MIYRIFFGKLIDLSRVIAVDEDFTHDEIDGLRCIRIEIHFQFLTLPIVYAHEVEFDSDSKYIHRKVPMRDIKAYQELKPKLDQFIQDWKDWKSKSSPHDHIRKERPSQSKESLSVGYQPTVDDSTLRYNVVPPKNP